MSGDMSKVPWWFHVAACLLCFGAGMGVMWHGEHVPQVQPHAAAVIQSDGSRILERNPDKASPALPQIPKGSKVIRVTTATVEKVEEKNSNSLESVDGKPVTVQFTEIQNADGSTRMIASSESGKIIGGSDWTEERVQAAPNTYHWQALAVVQATRQGPVWGASVGYAKGPLIASVTVIPGNGGAVQAGIGVRW